MTPRTIRSSMRSGTLLGERYTLGNRLGARAHGSVWSGHDTIVDRPVTITALAPELAADESTRERFRRVALRVASLAVPGVVDVHDCLEEPDPDGGILVCHVTERVPGRCLRDILAETGALSPSRALALMTGVARSLHAAHQNDVVHGNLNPDNLIVTADDAVTVIDFGFRTPEPSPYTAPELSVDSVAADVYGLGAIVYECLTGQAPSADGDISPLLHEFDPADAAPIMKAMSPQVNHRFTSAAAFADACLHIEPARAAHAAAIEPSDPETTDTSEGSRMAPAASPVAGEAIEESDDGEADAAVAVEVEAAGDHPEADQEPDEADTSPASSEAGPPSSTSDSVEEPTSSETIDEASQEDSGSATVRPAAAASTSASTSSSDDPPGESGTDSGDVPSPRRSMRTQALVIGILLAVITIAAGLLHFTAPGQPTGSQHTPEPTRETSQSDAPSSSSATDVDQSANPAKPAPTTSSPRPTPSDDPTSSHDGVAVPFVVGKTREQATAELSAAGFLVIVNESGEGKLECRVHQQSPAAGETAPSGSTVQIGVRRVHSAPQCIGPS